MKVTVNNNNSNSKEINYPCLMISHNDLIVLFSSEGEGILLKDLDNVLNTQHYSKCWDMGGFKPFEGSVTLQNDAE